MADSYRARIPFESLDPLTIGASDDESKVYREELELEIPEANLLAAISPDEPEPVPSATEAARQALASPTSGPSFAELLRGAGGVAVIIDNQFRPTPASKLLPPVLDAIEAAGIDACVITANGKAFPLSESDIVQNVSRENLDRMEATMNSSLTIRGRITSLISGPDPSSRRVAIDRINEIYAYENPVQEHGQANIAICGVFAPTDHRFFHTGWGCMSADFVLKDGGP